MLSGNRIEEPDSIPSIPSSAKLPTLDDVGRLASPAVSSEMSTNPASFTAFANAGTVSYERVSIDVGGIERVNGGGERREKAYQ